MSWTLSEHNYKWFASLCVVVTSSEVSLQGKVSYLFSLSDLDFALSFCFDLSRSMY
jgi:hypothetical protein